MGVLGELLLTVIFHLNTFSFKIFSFGRFLELYPFLTTCVFGAGFKYIMKNQYQPYDADYEYLGFCKWHVVIFYALFQVQKIIVFH